MKIVGPNTIKFETKEVFQWMMSNFSMLVEMLEREYGFHKEGLFKIIPPDNWDSVEGSLTREKLKQLYDNVERPYYQEYEELFEGIFHCSFKDIKKRLTIGQCYAMAEKKSFNFPDFESHEDREKTFWQNVGKVRPFYGTQVEANVMDSPIFNMSKLDTILNIVEKRIPGVNSSYTYIGSNMSTFNIHVEDKDLYSLNIVLYGSAKVWYVVRPADGHKLQDLVQNLVVPKVDEYNDCKNCMRHKSLLITPDFLDKNGIRYTKIVQNKNEMMCVTPFAYHFGYNEGPNIAEAINFASDRWLEYGKRSQSCLHDDDEEVFEMDQFVQKYEKPEVYKRWMDGLDVKPHPELSSRKKYQFMQVEFNKLAEQHSELKEKYELMQVDFDKIVKENSEMKRLILGKLNEVKEQNSSLNSLVKDNETMIEEHQRLIVEYDLKDIRRHPQENSKLMKHKKAFSEKGKNFETLSNGPEKSQMVDKKKTTTISKKGDKSTNPAKLRSCHQCEYKTNRLDNLKTHLSTHEAGNPFHCKECNSTFKLKQYLHRHVKFVHGAKELLKCSATDCTYSTIHKGNLQRHLKNKHR